MRLLSILYIAVFGMSCEPHPLKVVLENRYPNCQVIRIGDVERGYVEASLQCGPVIKSVRYRSR